MRWWLFALAVATVSALAIADEICNCSNNQTLSKRTLATKFTYKATVPEIPKDAKVLELWLP
ncbi:MAG: hypothetical protein NZ805_15200, partial [Armatimonadetes bacterium]|nr:hypothetical protein [Armatimonadota bacterium]MDW8029915.1 hypothetical protein [Armatimonadota bacterium]